MPNEKKGGKIEEKRAIIKELINDTLKWGNTKIGKCSMCGSKDELNVDYGDVCPNCQVKLIIRKAFDCGRHGKGRIGKKEVTDFADYTKIEPQPLSGRIHVDIKKDKRKPNTFTQRRVWATRRQIREAVEWLKNQLKQYCQCENHPKKYRPCLMCSNINEAFEDVMK
jgi:hypothetical protein